MRIGLDISTGENFVLKLFSGFVSLISKQTLQQLYMAIFLKLILHCLNNDHWQYNHRSWCHVMQHAVLIRNLLVYSEN